MAALCLATSNRQQQVEKDNTGTDENGSCASYVTKSLECLPVDCLQVDKKIIESLQQMGITDCKALFALPQSGLNRRFGIYFVDYLQRLLG